MIDLPQPHILFSAFCSCWMINLSYFQVANYYFKNWTNLISKHRFPNLPSSLLRDAMPGLSSPNPSAFCPRFLGESWYRQNGGGSYRGRDDGAETQVDFVWKWETERNGWFFWLFPAWTLSVCLYGSFLGRPICLIWNVITWFFEMNKQILNRVHKTDLQRRNRWV